MPTLTFHIKYKTKTKNIISARYFKELYLFGVDIKNGQGEKISDEAFVDMILMAQSELETKYSLFLQLQKITESRQYFLRDFKQWGKVSTTYPVVKACGMSGYIGETKQIDVPLEWLSIKTSSTERYYRTIHWVPSYTGTGAGTQNYALLHQGISTANLGLIGNANIPNYWRLSYISGFKEIPKLLLNYVGKLAGLNAFAIAGDLVLGAGVGSQSLSIDGLSQSISSTASATSSGYNARMLAYIDDLKRLDKDISKIYTSIPLTAL